MNDSQISKSGDKETFVLTEAFSNTGERYIVIDLLEFGIQKYEIFHHWMLRSFKIRIKTKYYTRFTLFVKKSHGFIYLIKWNIHPEHWKK